MQYGRTWRVRILTVLWLVYSINLLISGDDRTRRFVLLTWAGLASLFAFVRWSGRHLEHPAVRVLFRDRPHRTDDADLTKSDRYRMAFAYLGVGVLALVLLLVVAYLLGSVRSHSAQTALVVLLPFVIFPAGMGILGGIYLLVRAALRKGH